MMIKDRSAVQQATYLETLRAALGAAEETSERERIQGLIAAVEDAPADANQPGSE